MCGICAYKGSLPAAPLLLEALRKLEYRGYDSAGIATLDAGQIAIKRGVGKVGEVDTRVGFLDLKGTIGIAHTRWATTGGVTEMNAHPQRSMSGRFAIVHNGIVENYQGLREQLTRAGYKFTSDTDTEVLVNLIEHACNRDVLHAIQYALSVIHGRNTFVILDATTGELFAARKGSPLLLGIVPTGILLASDASPIIEHTHDVVFLEDDEIVHLNTQWIVYDATTLSRKEKKVERIAWTIEQAQKGNHPHYMIKEILEQRATIGDALAQDRELIERVAKHIDDAYGTYIVGCGSAGKVGLAATYAFSSIAKKHLNFALGSEFPSYHHFLTEESLVIAISQSGETADTLEAIETARANGCTVISIVNVLGSTMDRLSHETIPVHAGPEKSVCSTKATTGQLTVVYLLAYALAGRYDEGVEALQRVAHGADTMLTPQFCKDVQKIALDIVHAQSMYVLGRGASYPIALEAAIKIQEVSYIHAEGFASGELKHGPIALIERHTPCIVLVPNDETREDVITNALEVKARGGYLIGIGPERNEAFDAWIETPDVGELGVILSLIPIQLLAYYMAVARGNDVDMPRNLAKSVTVK